MVRCTDIGGIWTVLPLMSLVERFATFCFTRDLAFFGDAELMRGSSSHRALRPRMDQLRVYMPAHDFDRLLEIDAGPLGFHLMRDEPALLRVRLGQERIDVVRAGPEHDRRAGARVPMWCGLMSTLSDEHDSHDCPADAVRLLPQFDTLEAGLAAHGIARPFIVRQCPGFDLDASTIEAALVREPELLAYVFHPGGADETPRLQPRAALELFRAGKLQFNITESQATQLCVDRLPIGLRPRLDAHDEFAISYLVTPRGTDTPFHQDRPGQGAYLYIVEGEKYWWFIDRELADGEQLFRRPMTAILTEDDYRLWGRVQVVQQRAGDLVVFPADSWHRVLSYRAALGIGGYLRG